MRWSVEWAFGFRGAWRREIDEVFGGGVAGVDGVEDVEEFGVEWVDDLLGVRLNIEFEGDIEGVNIDRAPEVEFVEEEVVEFVGEGARCVVVD